MTCRLLLHRLGSSALLTASIGGLHKLWGIEPVDMAIHSSLVFLTCIGVAIGSVWWFAMWILKN